MDISHSNGIDNLNEDMLRTIFKAIPTHVFYKDLNFRYRLLSDLSRQYNFELTGQDITGKTDFEVFDDRELAEAFRRDDLQIVETKKSIHYVSQIHNNDIYYYDVYKKPVLDDNGDVIGIIGVINDITEVKNMAMTQMSLNRIDALTKLYSRNYYEERLLSVLHENNMPLSIIVGDTDRLKYVNDHYGHLTGDDLLRCTADILRRAVGEDDEIFRIGGDEFVIFCPRTDEESCLQIIDRIKSMESSCDFQLPVFTSLGYALAETTQDNLLEKISLAEKNMYKEKAISHQKEAHTSM